MSEASDSHEERAFQLHGATVEQFRKNTVCYHQDGEFRCGAMGRPAEMELHHRMLAAAQQLESNAIRDDSGAIENPNLVAARQDLYRAIYTNETAIGSENLDFSQFGEGADYEAKTGLSESDIEARYAPSMDGSVGNICPETGTDPSASIMKSLNAASDNMEYAKRDGEQSLIVKSWWLVNDSLSITNDIRTNDADNALNAIDQFEPETQSPEAEPEQASTQVEEPEQLEPESELEMTPDNGGDNKKKKNNPGSDLDLGM